MWKDNVSVKLVDNKETMQAFLRAFTDIVTMSYSQSTSPPTLHIDLEGIALSRRGTISLLTLLIHDPPSRDTVYLIDIHTLGARTFSITSPQSHLPSNAQIKAGLAFTTLREILQASIIRKVIFDCRNDQDALFAAFELRLRGVVDLQLMEVAARYQASMDDEYAEYFDPKPPKYVRGLAKCIECDSGMDAAQVQRWKTTKAEGNKNLCAGA